MINALEILTLPEHCDRDPQPEMGLMRLTLARSPEGDDQEGVRDAPATDDFIKQQTTDEFSKGMD